MGKKKRSTWERFFYCIAYLVFSNSSNSSYNN